MQTDRQGSGFAIVRIAIGVFFIFEGLGKLQWFMDPSNIGQSVPAMDAGGRGRICQP